MAVSVAEAEAIIAAVRAVSRSEIMPRFRNLDPDAVDAKSAPDDLVTIADKRAELELTERFATILPGAVVIGEEAVSAGAADLGVIAQAERCVIIDPIDGTWNYANGIATFGVIIAVVEGGETVFGLLYDPVLDDAVLAHRGQGAWFVGGGRRQALQLDPPAPDPADLFGFVGMYLYDQPTQKRIAPVLPLFRRIGTLRCSCHEYRVMTTGGAAFDLNCWLNPWDHAAGALIYSEAGGVLRLLDGQPYRPDMTKGRLLAACSEPVWSAVHALFAPIIPAPDA